MHNDPTTQSYARLVQTTMRADVNRLYPVLKHDAVGEGASS